MALESAPWLRNLVEAGHLRALAEWPHAVAESTQSIHCEGVIGSASALVAGALAVNANQTVMLVVAHLDEADDAMDDLEVFGSSLSTYRLGALEVLPGESSVNLELLAERLGVVEHLAGTHSVSAVNQSAQVIVAPIQALMQSVPEPQALSSWTRSLVPGMQLSPGQLLDWLSSAGYERQDAVESPGDFAMRGGVVDLWPPAGSVVGQHGEALPIGPIRIDFFGDEIDALLSIDPDTLASSQRLKQARIIGARYEQLHSDTNTMNVIDLLPEHSTVVLHETMEVSEQARGYYERLTNPVGIYAPPTVMQKLMEHRFIEANHYSPKRKGAEVVTLPIEPLPIFETEAREAIGELAGLTTDASHEVVVLCRRSGEVSRLEELLQAHHPASASRIAVLLGSIHRGFAWKTEQGKTLYLVPHHELFHRYETGRRVRKVVAASGGATAGSHVSDAFLDLDVGDYVVHVDHGIARFTGLKTLRRQGKTAEYLTLEFAEKAILHVPLTQIDLIQKYAGGFQGRPPLSTLGGKKWKHQKEQVRDAVKDLAAELLRVHAARETQPGITYPSDTTWMQEFEAAFPYDETLDQQSAIAAIKRDMSQSTPMDRLVCGDVGFGKTEVAIRAAFKAVEYGKQVAVLVPTTVLAEQHERTFKSRFADYPFSVESISRFKTNVQQRDMLKRLKLGQLDIIIGTHRLLSGDVHFNDLGMVIIDEEQRFGVEHKNKLLKFRLTADVLTLTATPIPRTLHMAMVGLRDISSLSTPPVDRRAVVTEVIPFNTKRIQQALIRELSRDGQAFFVHNRVQSLHAMAAEVKTLVPEARVIVGHGQMSATELQQVMLKFVRREADVLVCTTIIESGIDIPTANTMFINMADHYGLAELHQLRGRVGRYKHRAYCYLLLPPHKSVSEVAAKRLKAIEGYSMLGAGFKIAMRDLEIRGAGNLLGAEQSGHIAAVGYEMYCLLLEQETKRLRHEPILETSKTHLELPVTGSIARKYIPSDKHRMDAYRRLSRASEMVEFDAVVDSILDAYGQAPAETQTLMDVCEVRLAASVWKIDRLQLESPDVIFNTDQPKELAKLFDSAPGRVTVLDGKTLYWRPPENYLAPETLLAVLRKLLVRPLRDRAVQASEKTPDKASSKT